MIALTLALLFVCLILAVLVHIRASAGRQRAILEEIERPRIEAEKRANSERLPLSFWLLGLYDAYGFEMEEQAWRDAKEAARQASAQRRAQRNGRIEY